MIPGAICANCVFFAVNPHWRGPSDQQGQCRRHAPILDQSGERPRTIWPLAWESQWCGEHATIEDEPA